MRGDAWLAILGLCMGVVLTALVLVALPTRFKLRTVCDRK